MPGLYSDHSNITTATHPTSDLYKSKFVHSAKLHRPRRRSSLCYCESAESSSPTSTDSRPVIPLCRPCKSAILDPSTSSSVIDCTPVSSSDTTLITPAVLSTHVNYAPQHRRRSSLAESKRALIGSYEECLLSGRMSAPSSTPVEFSLKVGVLAIGPCSPKLRCPAHIKCALDAVYYDHQLHDIGIPGPGSPYVGSVDLTEHYLRMQTSSIPRKNKNPEPEKKQKKSFKFPGYRIPVKGRIQLLVSNEQQTGVAVMLVPYDLESLKVGEKTFIRYKTYTVPPPSSCSNGLSSSSSNLTSSASSTHSMQDKHFKTDSKQNVDSDLVAKHPVSTATVKARGGHLIRAAHLQMACVGNGKYYLCGELRLTFRNRDEDGTVESVTVMGDRSALNMELLGGGASKMPTNSERGSRCSRCEQVMTEESKSIVLDNLENNNLTVTTNGAIRSRKELKEMMLIDIKNSALDVERP